VSVFINIDLLPESYFLEKSPFFRIIIHNLLSSFFVLSAWIALNANYERRWSIIKRVTDGFMVTLIVGFVLYLLVLSELIPIQVYDKVNVLTQMGYGFLRFTCGSYPNEFGVMSAFFCTLSCYLLVNKHMCFEKKYLYLLFIMSFMAMALSTTRAAYLSFGMGLIYLLFTSGLKSRIRFLQMILVIALLLVLILPKDVCILSLNILETGYYSAVNVDGSMATRYSSLVEAWQIFMDNPLRGIGFENPKISMMHNTYLQFLFGFGLVGISLLLLVILLICFIFRSRHRIVYEKYDEHYRCITIIGLINVASFSLSNHNQNHFLTWFVVFLFLSSGCLCKRIRK
jgi:O-antigen ligase